MTSSAIASGGCSSASSRGATYWAKFPIEMERFRVAPCYDFSRPPHAGPLWYEILGFSMGGEMWRRAAAETFACVA